MPDLTEFKSSAVRTNVLAWDDGDSRIRLSQYPADDEIVGGKWAWQVYCRPVSACAICDTLEQAHAAAEAALPVLRETAERLGVRP